MMSIEALSETLRGLARPGMTPKALRAAVRERHPEASRKDIVRAAFHVLIEAQPQGEIGVNELHDFALAQRAPDDEPPVTIGARRGKKHRRRAGKAAAAA
jgi:hypothetical protein